MQSLTCSSKAECGSDLEQGSIESEDNSLFIGARTMCYEEKSIHECIINTKGSSVSRFNSVHDQAAAKSCDQ